MLWIKSFHIIFMVSWFAGLFYLPRLFVHHAMTTDPATRERLKIMERKLFFFTLPWAALTIILGLWLWFGYGYSGGWLHIKVTLVGVLVAYQVLCWRYLLAFRDDRNTRSDRFYRWFNEFPLLILVAIIFLVEFKLPV